MSRRIPQHKIDELYAVADIVDIIGEFLQLKKRGSNYFALSPFSNEKTPSFAVSPSKNIYKDFSSGKGGNAISFLMDLEGMTYVEALKWVANRYNIDLEIEEVQEDEGEKDMRESLYVLNQFAARWFNQELTESKGGKEIALTYLKERGLLDATISEFEVGYSPNDWEAFSKEAIKNKFQEEYLVESGLCFKSDKDGKLLDRFKGRVMFPIHDHLGKVLGFGGRILGNKEKAAKYINSPESPVYNKSRVLYGLYFAKQSIRDKDVAILVEGYLDVISLYQAGIKNVVATSGTALTDDQIRLLKRFSENVLLIYDADPAGIKAALRGADLMLERGLNVKVLLLPEKSDPDSFVKEHGKSGFEAYQDEHSADFVDFKIRHLLGERDGSDPNERSRIIHDVADTIAKIPDNVKQGVYLSFAAEKLSVGEEILRNALNQSLQAIAKQEARQERFKDRRQEHQAPRVEPQLEAEPTLDESQERELLRILMNHSDKSIQIGEEEEEIGIVEYISHELENLEFDNPVLEAIKLQLFQQFEENGKISIHHFLNHPDEEIRQMSTDLLTIPVEVSPNWEKFDIKAARIDEFLEDSVNSPLMHFRFKKVKKLLTENQEKIRECNEETELERLLQLHNHLISLKKQLSDAMGITIHD